MYKKSTYTVIIYYTSDIHSYTLLHSTYILYICVNGRMYKDFITTSVKWRGCFQESLGSKGKYLKQDCKTSFVSIYVTQFVFLNSLNL